MALIELDHGTHLDGVELGPKPTDIAQELAQLAVVERRGSTSSSLTIDSAKGSVTQHLLDATAGKGATAPSIRRTQWASEYEKNRTPVRQPEQGAF